MADFMCPLHWVIGVQMFGYTLFWVCLRGCFRRRLAFEFVYVVKQMALPSVGGLHLMR